MIEDTHDGFCLLCDDWWDSNRLTPRYIPWFGYAHISCIEGTNLKISKDKPITTSIGVEGIDREKIKGV